MPHVRLARSGFEDPFLHIPRKVRPKIKDRAAEQSFKFVHHRSIINLSPKIGDFVLDVSDIGRQRAETVRPI